MLNLLLKWLLDVLSVLISTSLIKSKVKLLLDVLSCAYCVLIVLLKHYQLLRMGNIRKVRKQIR